MRRSPLRYISWEFCGFYFVTQGFFCNETKSFYRHKAIERATSSYTQNAQRRRIAHYSPCGVCPPSPLGKAYHTDKPQFFILSNFDLSNRVKWHFTVTNYLHGTLFAVGRGLAPPVSLNLKGFHGGSKPPPYIVDRSINRNFSFFQILIYRTAANSLLQRRRGTTEGGG